MLSIAREEGEENRTCTFRSRTNKTMIEFDSLRHKITKIAPLKQKVLVILINSFFYFSFVSNSLLASAT